MATATTARLLQAIEGFTGENAGNKSHESNIELLNRVKGEIQKGQKTPDSIGTKEAKAAAQKGMPAEQSHSPGGGNTRSNEPGSGLARNEPVVDLHSGSAEERKMASAGPVPSRGSTVSNAPGPAAPSGIVEIRRMAALKDLEAGRSSEGNKESVAPAPTPAKGDRIGNVAAPAAAPPDRNRTGDLWEGNPAGGLAGAEKLSKDGWTRAREKARKIAPAAR